MGNYRVYDDRTDDTLFTGTQLECMCFVTEKYPNDSDDFPHIWVGRNN